MLRSVGATEAGTAFRQWRSVDSPDAGNCTLSRTGGVGHRRLVAAEAKPVRSLRTVEVTASIPEGGGPVVRVSTKPDPQATTAVQSDQRTDQISCGAPP